MPRTTAIDSEGPSLTVPEQSIKLTAGPSISVVVPVFNSEQSLPVLTARLELVLAAFCSRFEVLLIDDGSRDSSWAVISDLAAMYPWVQGIRLMRNYGQHNAVLCGMREARYEVIVTLDDDLQNPPEALPKLVAPLRDGFDVVYGTPVSQRHCVLRDAASYITKAALKSAMGVTTARNVSAFRALRREVVAGFSAYRGSFVSIDVLITWGTTRVTAVPVCQEERVFGSSQYTLGKLIRHALNMVTGFSTLPLQLATFVGFTFALFGVAALSFVCARYLLNGATVPGFSFLASLIAIFSGAQLFALGIVGEYLARMHVRLMDRPSYTVRAATREVAKR